MENHVKNGTRNSIPTIGTLSGLVTISRKFGSRMLNAEKDRTCRQTRRSPTLFGVELARLLQRRRSSRMRSGRDQKYWGRQSS